MAKGVAAMPEQELQEMVRGIVREELGRSVQDVEEIRRSPAGAVIRIEEDIKAIRREMATKEELRRLEVKLVGFSERLGGVPERIEGLSEKMESLSGRVEGLSERVEGLAGRLNLVIGLMFAMLTLYGGLIVKLMLTK